MYFFEFITPKPRAPEQEIVNSIKQRKHSSEDALKAEKDRQKKQKAVSAIQQNNATLAKICNS
jgi:hypothetical protein